MFKGLFWKIFTEHAGLQVAIYSAIGTVTAILLFVQPEYGFIYSILTGAAFAIGLKSLSALSSVIKTFIIICGCKKKDPEFLDIYTDWTGKKF